MRSRTLSLTIFMIFLPFLNSFGSLKGTIGDEVVLQIITDRFKDGNFHNNIPSTLTSFGEPVEQSVASLLYDPSKTNRGHYFGGDLQGLIDMAEEIKESGVSAIWISPHILQATTLNGEVSSYHGYWGKDWFQLDPHLTNNGPKDYNLFKKFIDTYHSKGIKVIIDFVFNHTNSTSYIPVGEYVSIPKMHEQGRLEKMGQFIADFSNDFITDPYIKKPNWFNPVIRDQLLLEYCEYYGTYDPKICHDTFGIIYDLPDFNTFHKPYIDYMKEAIDFWIGFGIDGLRIDTFRNLPVKTLNLLLSYASTSFHSNRADGKNFPIASDLLLIGEYYGSVLDNNQAINFAGQVKANDRSVSVLDFPLAFKIRYLFGSRGGSDYSAQNLTNYLQNLYNSNSESIRFVTSNMTTFFDNHDQELLIHNTWNEYPKYSKCNKVGGYPVYSDKDMQGELINYKKSINQAVTFLLSLNGMPILYYATLAQIQPSCYPYNFEGLCSRPFLNGPLISDHDLKAIVYNFSKRRRRTWENRKNPFYNPVFRYGDFRKLKLPTKDFYSDYVSCQKHNQRTNKFDRNDLTVAFERCTKDKQHCLLFISSVNFKARNEKDYFEISNLRFKPGKYRNLAGNQVFSVEKDGSKKSKISISIGNYENIVIAY